MLFIKCDEVTFCLMICHGQEKRNASNSLVLCNVLIKGGKEDPRHGTYELRTLQHQPPDFTDLAG